MKTLNQILKEHKFENIGGPIWHKKTKYYSFLYSFNSRTKSISVRIAASCYSRALDHVFFENLEEVKRLGKEEHAEIIKEFLKENGGVLK